MKKDIEKALKEFLMDVRTTGEERKKGIPLITFVYKEEDKAVLLKALPLPLADIQPERDIPVGKELLYRVDFFKEGEAKVSFGVLPAIKEPATFLTLLDNAVKTGDRKAGYQGLCDYLKLHNALCGLEALAEGELSFAGRVEIKAGEEMKDRYTPANTAYYREVLSYVQTGKSITQGRGRNIRGILQVSPRKINRMHSGRRTFQGQVQEYRRKRRYRDNPMLEGMQGIFWQMIQQNPVSRSTGTVQAAGMEANVEIWLYSEISM